MRKPPRNNPTGGPSRNNNNNNNNNINNNSNKNTSYNNNGVTNGNGTCSFCGNTGHGVKSPPALRQGQCPAYNHTCSFCGILHHQEHMCRKRQKAAADGSNGGITCTDVLFDCPDQLCSLSTLGTDLAALEPIDSTTLDAATSCPPVSQKHVVEVPAPLDHLTDDQPPATTTATIEPEPMRASEAASATAAATSESGPTQPSETGGVAATEPVLDHHVYDKKSARWIKPPSKPQPFLKLGISIHPEDYVNLGIPPKVRRRMSASLHVMADTGCMSCLIGMKLLHRIGLRRTHLTPCSMSMETANHGSINIKHNWFRSSAPHWSISN